MALSCVSDGLMDYTFLLTPIITLLLTTVQHYHSPRWLLTKDSSSLEGRLVINKLRNLKDEKEVY